MWLSSTTKNDRSPAETAMDLSDVGVRHAVSFATLNIRHSVDISPTAVSIAREVRYCVIAVVLGFATVSIVKSLFSRSNRTFDSSH